MKKDDPSTILEGTEMRSQFFTEGKPVDLNCGRYCTEAAIKWWGKERGVFLGDVFHELLPEPTPMYGMKIAWSPASEGRDLTFTLRKPKDLQTWKQCLVLYGPLIISGELGEVSSKLGWYVGHFILLVGVDVSGQKIICRDPLKASEGLLTFDFDWIQPRINGVSAVDADKVIALRQKIEDKRRSEAMVSLRPGMSRQQSDRAWNDML